MNRVEMDGGGGSQICVITVCFASKFVSFGSTETPQLAALLFQETVEANFFFA
jgi:hypothetical protein